MDYYSKVPFSLKPFSKSKYLNTRPRYNEYIRSSTNSRANDKKSQNLNLSLDPLYESSIDPLPNLSRTFKKSSQKKTSPSPSEAQKHSFRTMRKLYSPLQIRQPLHPKPLKKNTGVIKLQQFLTEFHQKSKLLLSQLEADFKKNCLNE